MSYLRYLCLFVGGIMSYLRYLCLFLGGIMSYLRYLWHKFSSLVKASNMADEYVLTHKLIFLKNKRAGNVPNLNLFRIESFLLPF